ncbi:hypothetical protein [Borreliella garinii]|uniref:hypothetical protein n=1 Tax=Borreliella garinii TaxID=29519 RepID=UPI00398240AD
MSKAIDEIYCHSCSKPIKKEAEICIAVGLEINTLKAIIKFYFINMLIFWLFRSS